MTKKDYIAIGDAIVTTTQELGEMYNSAVLTDEMIEDIARRLVKNLLPVFKADNELFNAVKFNEFVLNGGSRAKQG